MNRLLLLSNFVSSKESQASSADKIIVERKEELAILWMNSPTDNNTITAELVKQLLPALLDLDNDKTTKVIILRSKVKKVFSSGGDIK
jgi:enoyl-CoA hydratase